MNMLNLNPWVEYVFENFVINHPVNEKKDKRQVQFIAINSMAYIITNMISEVLWRATGVSNIPEDYRSYVNMKNEFLFSRMILASKKKRYMCSVTLREGEEFYPEKMDAKGLDFKKSTTSKEVEAKYTNMVKTRILHSEEIDLDGMISDVTTFESDIKESLENGNKEYLTPMSVKELEAYADPYKGQGIRAVHAWNSIYPDMSIELPAKIDLVKLTLDNPINLARLANDHPDIYEKVDKYIIKSPNEKIAKKGLVVIAIPKNIKMIPEWIIPYIDYDTLSCNIIKKIRPILSSLGFRELRTSKNEYFSNIIDI